MSSETRFALSHSGFWNALLPMGEPYIRTRNSNPAQFAPQMVSLAPASQRGVVNEFAFLLFKASVDNATSPFQLPAEVMSACANTAIAYVSKMPRNLGSSVEEISAFGRIEAQALAERLQLFFGRGPSALLDISPRFPGCGWVDEAEGDVWVAPTLYEIKAGERHFRITDLRQLLCYCALSFSAKSRKIEKICLVNPRFGTFIEEDLELLCLRTAGIDAARLLSEIVEYMSEPVGRYAGA